MKMRPVPLSEVGELILGEPLKYAALIALGVTTGCRVTELLLLRRFDLLTPEGDLKSLIRFRKLKTRRLAEKPPVRGRPAKVRRESRSPGYAEGTAGRELELPAGFREVVEEHLIAEELRGYDRPDDWVFRGTCGDHLSRQTVYRHFRERLGQGHGTHWMRKTFARAMVVELEKGLPEGEKHQAPMLLQKALGHARLDSTLHYLETEERRIVAAQRAAFGGVLRCR